MNIKEEAVKMKLDAPVLAASPISKRNEALEKIAESLLANKDEIFAANEADLAAAEENNIGEAVKKRLKFNQAKLDDCIKGIKQLMSLADPVGKMEMARELDAGLTLYRVSVPIGVIGVIFEARPDAMVQISSLCIKSGNCAILKGGKETAKTNKVLFTIIKEAVVEAGLPANCLMQCELHNEIDELLECDREVDLLIPRGSNKFVRYIMEHTKIPVMGHADGICHIYVDKDYDRNIVLPIIVDAKTQYTAACNSVETILVNRDVAAEFLPELKKACDAAGIKVHGTKEVADIIRCDSIMQEDEFRKEYLSLDLSVRIVADVKEAANHINYFGSHHTDSIITDNREVAEYFMQMVDSAGVYQNCSTRFADGFRYGFGAEVGISTSKLHARGPVGLEGLVTYKYKLFGHGQIVGDYASGKSSFNFKDLNI